MNYKEIALAGHMAVQFNLIVFANVLIYYGTISIGEGMIVISICTGTLVLIGKQ